MTKITTTKGLLALAGGAFSATPGFSILLDSLKGPDGWDGVFIGIQTAIGSVVFLLCYLYQTELSKKPSRYFVKLTSFLLTISIAAALFFIALDQRCNVDTVHLPGSKSKPDSAFFPIYLTGELAEAEVRYGNRYEVLENLGSLWVQEKARADNWAYVATIAAFFASYIVTFTSLSIIFGNVVFGLVGHPQTIQDLNIKARSGDEGIEDKGTTDC